MTFNRVVKLFMISVTLVFLVACASEDTEETVSVSTSEDITEEVNQENTEEITETITEDITDATTETVTTTIATTATTTTEAASIYVPATIEEVASAYNEVINSLKEEQNLIITQSDDVTFEITDCSVSAVKSIMNTFIDDFISDESVTYDFTNGVTSDGATVTSVIYPSDRLACVTASDLVVGTATATAEGGYILHLQIVEEYISTDGTNIQEPPSHYTTLDIISNLPLLDDAPIEIANVDAYFSGAIIEVTVGADSKVQSIYAYQPLEGTGSGEITIFTVEVSMGGTVESTFEISYK